MAVKILLWTAALGGLAALAVNRGAASREARAEAAFPPVGEIVEVAGTAIHVKVEGSGPPLVLLHGAGGNLRDFDPLAASLRDRYTVVRFDRPGLGWSDLPPGQGGVLNRDVPDPGAQAALLHQAYARLGLGPAVILGQSFGGVVALAWTLNHPQDAAGLVVVSAPSHRWEAPLAWTYPVAAHPLGAATFVPFVAATMNEKGVSQVLARVFDPQEPPENYAQTLGAGLSMRRKTMRANSRQVQGLRAAVTRMSPRYSEIAVPTEILHGDADTVVSIDIHPQALADAIPGSVFTRLPGIGHMPHHSAPGEVLAAIDRAATRAGLRPGPGTGKVDP